MKGVFILELYQSFRSYLKEYINLESFIHLLVWDQSTGMPTANADYRGEQLGFISRLTHEKLVDPKMGEMLDQLIPWATTLPADSLESRLISEVAKEYEKARKIPPAFMEKFFGHTARVYQTWVKARKQNNFTLVSPLLRETLEYSKEYASYFPGYHHIADPLIDRSDEGMYVSILQPLFQDLRKKLVPMIEQIRQSEPVDRKCLLQHYPKQKQLQFIEVVLDHIGVDRSRTIQDFSPHPFMIRLAGDDVRFTTRIKEWEVTDGLFSSMHESGHALYELGISPELFGTPLMKGISSGLHESQSRLWENLVGKSREFWEYFYPKLQSVFPTQLGAVPMETFYRAMHHVSPSEIRTEADEITYNLHVIIRFDLELELLTGKLDVTDLPEAWRQRYKEDLGVDITEVKDGVLQDVHWFTDFIGGQFQGYSIGNILSCQLFDAAQQIHPSIKEEMTHGQFDTLHSWLKTNIYQHGKKFSTTEMIQRATGQALSIDPYIKYLTEKYQTIYPTLHISEE
ncbi:carboxypeptidase M32 [Shimazuella sp. KC615]|uniref:Metal-dependent carboxypeptidase n=1 Tax=Shimazuella alba TaxID=2690964 RepID=A0A6I4VU25_9BACL|nr:carboxypeptidase M32 [Shimazuella alba]